MSDPIIIAIISAGAALGAGGGLWSAFTIRAQRRALAATARLHDAEAITVFGTKSVAMLKPLQDRIEHLEARLDVANDKLDRVTDKAEHLEEIHRRYQREILADHADLTLLREMVRADRAAQQAATNGQRPT